MVAKLLKCVKPFSGFALICPSCLMLGLPGIQPAVICMNRIMLSFLMFGRQCCSCNHAIAVTLDLRLFIQTLAVCHFLDFNKFLFGVLWTVVMIRSLSMHGQLCPVLLFHRLNGRRRVSSFAYL